MQTARRGQSLPKRSVVRHSKIGSPMTLWVNRVAHDRDNAVADVRNVPKADIV
jgi:hypothetical protein